MGVSNDERCDEMSVRNGHLAIAFRANVAVTNGRVTPRIVEMALVEPVNANRFFL